MHSRGSHFNSSKAKKNEIKRYFLIRINLSMTKKVLAKKTFYFFFQRRKEKTIKVFFAQLIGLAIIVIPHHLQFPLLLCLNHHPNTSQSLLALTTGIELCAKGIARIFSDSFDSIIGFSFLSHAVSISAFTSCAV